MTNNAPPNTATPSPHGVQPADQAKGAVEGDRPTDTQTGNPLGAGIDGEGLPNDPVASAQDREGAEVDDTQG